MSSLLDLPYETRAQILGYAVQYTADAPTEVEIQQRVTDTQPQPRSGRILYPDSTLVDSSSIRLVNRQINREVRAVARSIRPVRYDLDLVVFRKGDKVIPTWTYISAPCDTVDVLTCTIRLQGKFESGARRSGFDAGDCGPPRLAWEFYDLIRGFANYGLQLRAAYKGQESQTYLIKKLVVDIRSPVLEEGTQWWPATGRAGFYRDGSPAGTIQQLNPIRMFAFLLRHMEILTQCDYHTGSYGQVVFMSIGQIEFRQDGATAEILDLDAKLSSAQDIPIPSGSGPYKVFPHMLRIYHTVQMWVPLIKKLRADSGLVSSAQEESEARVQDWNAIDWSYWKSWNTCLNLVKTTRPETR